MKTDTRKLLQYLKSAAERDESTVEYCERSKQSDNPQVLKTKEQAAARLELIESIIRAVENNDFVDLKTFTKLSH